MKLQYLNSDELAAKVEEERHYLRKWFSQTIHLWPWFLCSLIVCLSIASFYLYYTAPAYRAFASVMIKDETKGPDLVDNTRSKQLGIESPSKLIVNEIEILSSYDLLDNVVDTLQLFVSAKRMGLIRDVPVFGDEMPFTIKILNPGAIKSTNHWIFTETTNAVIFRNLDDNHPVQVPFGQIYNANGILFLCTKGEGQFAPSPNNTEQNRNDYTIDILNSAKPASYKVDVYNPDQTVIQYRNKLEIQPANKVATIINLNLKDTNKKRALVILQALLNIYNQRELDNRNRVIDNTIAFLDDRLITVANELREVESSVESFKKENNFTNLSSDAEEYLAISNQVDVQKAQSQTQLNIINALEKDLQLNQNNPKLVPSTLGLQDPSLNRLIEKHNDLILQKEGLEQKAGPQNPLLIDMQNQIREIRTTLLSNVRNLKKAYEISLEDISQKDLQFTNRIRSVPQLEKKLIQITRNQNVQEQLYAFLLQKKEEATVSRASNLRDFQTVTRVRDLGQVSPNKNIVLAFAILMSMIFPIAILGVCNFLDNKVGDVAQVEQHTDVPLLGIISHVNQLKSSIIINSTSRTAVAEQIRNIRATINFLGKGRNVKTVLVTSFQPGDGKSFVSLNLAAGYALLNKKTIMLEFDLRRPHISKDLGLNIKEGISNILNGESKIDDLLVIVDGFSGYLSLLPAGHLDTNPTELISSPNMHCFINNLKERFDFVIINTPPLCLVSDATLLQQYADISLIVLRQNHTSREVYSGLKQQILRHPENPIYLLLNDVGKSRRYRSGYGYGGYSYGYDYGYGYGKEYFKEIK